MSKRFGSVGQQYLDANGDPLSGGKLNFYETGTTTRKNTYTTSAESVANANPVILDAAGRQGDIWFTGVAKVVLTDSADVEIDTTDPVGESASASGKFANYDASATYNTGDVVTATNGRYYRSITNSNTGNEPSVSASVWEEFRFLSQYNSAQTYIADDVVESGGRLYVSLVGSNQGNTPGAAPTYWRPLAEEIVWETSARTSNFTVVAGNGYRLNSSGGAFTVDLPAGVAGDKFSFMDYAGTFRSFNVTLAANGSEEILNDTGDHTLDVDNLVATMMYTADRGWVYI